MAIGRYYPTATTLPDGRVLVQGGTAVCTTCIADLPEIHGPVSNTWTAMAESARKAFKYYPHTYVLPDGRILVAAQDDKAVIRQALDLSTQTWTTIDSSIVDGHSSVMYRPGKIMKAGKATADDPGNPAVATTYDLDMTQPSPAWQATASMAFPRSYLNLTVLPDEQVLATGGGTTTDPANFANAVYEAEMWSPTTKTWTTMSAEQVPRLYHSIGLLLQDAHLRASRRLAACSAACQREHGPARPVHALPGRQQRHPIGRGDGPLAPRPWEDSQPPTPPGSLQATPGAGGVSLAGVASTDNVGVAEYRVERCTGSGYASFAQIGTTTKLAFDNLGLAAGTTYRYRVRAADAQGNLADYSGIVSGTTSAVAGGLVGAWGFNEGTGTTAADVSGFVNNGSIGGAMWTAAGKFGGALSFNGVNALVTVLNAPSLQLSSRMTLEAWVKPSVIHSAWRRRTTV